MTVYAYSARPRFERRGREVVDTESDDVVAEMDTAGKASHVAEGLLLGMPVGDAVDHARNAGHREVGNILVFPERR